jgi:hypothetical protein
MRTRSIKPDFWNHPQVIECSIEARLLFLGLWTHCDDGGRHPAMPKAIKGKVFPADTTSADQVTEMLKELVTNGLVVAYPAGEMTMLEIVNWGQWQRIKDPSFQWPDASGTIPTRRKVGGHAAKAREKTPDPMPKPAPMPEAERKIMERTEAHFAKHRAPRRGRTPPAPEPTVALDLAPFAEQVELYGRGKWKLEWGNPPGLGCELPPEVQEHMTTDGVKPAEQLEIE